MLPVYNKAVAISKSDTVNIIVGSDRLTDAVVVGATGVVACVFENDEVVNVTLVAGYPVPLRIKRVNDANTTATGMTALYRK